MKKWTLLFTSILFALSCTSNSDELQQDQNQETQTMVRSSSSSSSSSSSFTKYEKDVINYVLNQDNLTINKAIATSTGMDKEILMNFKNRMNNEK